MSTMLENNTTDLEELLNLANELSEAPVKSVNEKTGHVILTPSDIGAAPAYTYGIADMIAGTSALETGKLYFVYE